MFLDDDMHTDAAAAGSDDAGAAMPHDAGMPADAGAPAPVEGAPEGGEHHDDTAAV